MSRPPGGALRYDGYWASRDPVRTSARSRERARVALALLERRRLPPGRLLEVGCGPGWALEVFQQAGYRVVGLDLSPRAVESAGRRLSGESESGDRGIAGGGADVRALDIEAHTAEDLLEQLGGPFDIVAALEVLEHLIEPRRALEKLGRLLRPGGHFVLSLPNEIHLLSRLRILLGALPFGGHDDPHVRHFDRRSSRRLLQAAGARVLEERPVGLVPPRHPLAKLATSPLVRLLPGVFALSTVYLLEGPAHA